MKSPIQEIFLLQLKYLRDGYAIPEYSTRFFVIQTKFFQ